MQLPATAKTTRKGVSSARYSRRPHRRKGTRRSTLCCAKTNQSAVHSFGAGNVDMLRCVIVGPPYEMKRWTGSIGTHGSIGGQVACQGFTSANLRRINRITSGPCSIGIIHPVEEDTSSLWEPPCKRSKRYGGASFRRLAVRITATESGSIAVVGVVGGSVFTKCGCRTPIKQGMAGMLEHFS